MALKVAWTEQASEQFDRIKAWIGDQSKENDPSPFVKQVFDIVELLSVFPDMGMVEDKNRGIRGFLVSRYHRLFYRHTPTTLIVIAIFDMRMHPRNRKIR